MSKICNHRKRPVTGGRIIIKESAKKLVVLAWLVKNNKRKFRPNLQRVRQIASGQVKRIWVSVKAINWGLQKQQSKQLSYELGT